MTTSTLKDPGIRSSILDIEIGHEDKKQIHYSINSSDLSCQVDFVVPINQPAQATASSWYKISGENDDPVSIYQEHPRPRPIQ